MSEALEAWARRVLSNVSGLPPLRVRHIAGVVRRAAGVGDALLSRDDAVVVRAAAWLHDIGYAESLVDTSCHPIDGARHLVRLGAADDVIGLVAYHSGAEYEAAERGLGAKLADFPRPRDGLLDVLTYADMTTDTEGHGGRVEDRLVDIFDRYPTDDPVHVSVDASQAYLVAAVRRVEGHLDRPTPPAHAAASPARRTTVESVRQPAGGTN